MTARKILIIHSILFFSFVTFSLGSLALAITGTDFIQGRYLVLISIIIAILVIGSWKKWKGECPFTVLENRFHEHERAGSSYAGSCIDHYALEWFKLRLPPGSSTRGLKILMLIPIVVGVLNW